MVEPGAQPMTKQVTITIESRSLLIVHARRARGWCERCSADADLIALEQTDAILGADAGAADWLGAEEVHRSAAPDGSTLICVTSLLARVGREKTTGVDRCRPKKE
jgi:hypothetical protein